SGWDCSVAPACTRSDVLAPGTAYPTIQVNVNVAANAATPLGNSATASGGGSANSTTTDFTIVNQPNPLLTMLMWHAPAAFVQGQNEAFTVTVKNLSGGAATTGAVTVTDSVGAGLTLVSMSGSGWNCAAGGTTCSRSDPLSGGSAYPD